MKNRTEIIDGIEIGDGSTNVLIKKNKITGPLSHGINVGSSGNPSPEIPINKNLSIVDNEVKQIFQSCILLDDADEVTILRNKLSNCNLSDPSETAESPISVNPETTRNIFIGGS